MKHLVWTVAVCCGVSVLKTVSEGSVGNTSTDPASLNDKGPLVVESLSRGKPCGYENLCLCHGKTADCSKRNLTFIPQIGRRHRNLVFKDNALESIDTPNFFQNVTHIRLLDLSDNGIQYLCDDAFSLLTNVETLYFDGNRLNYTGLEPVFKMAKLVTLTLIGGQLGPVPDDLFHRVHMPRLKTVSLSHNTMPTFNMTPLVPLRSLEDLRLNTVQMVTFHSDIMPRLKRLSINNNQLSNLPVTCRHGQSLYPKLEQMFANTNFINSIDNTSVCLPALNFLSLKYNRFKWFKAGYFSETNFPRLQTLYITGMENKNFGVEVGAFSNPSLSQLYMSFNEIQFFSDAIDERVFIGCQNMTSLQLDRNLFVGISDRKLRALLSPLVNLKVLYLGHCGINTITTRTFQVLSRIEKLYLYGNRLAAIPDGAFDSLQHLKLLALDGNIIRTVSDTTFSPAIRASLVSLNLSNNPFECTCTLLWFHDWLTSQPSLFGYHHDKYSHYQCQNLGGQEVGQWIITQQMCLMSHTAYVLTVVLVGLLIVSMTTSIVLYRYRWNIRLLLYEAFRGNPQARWTRRRPQEFQYDLLVSSQGRLLTYYSFTGIVRQEALIGVSGFMLMHFLRWRLRRPQEFQYDLFVSYSKEDVGWVIQHLIPTMERGLDLRLCIHQRDFLLGNNIAHNIADSLAASKRVLVLFSPHFARSQWCQFELHVCLRHVVENDDVMVVAFLRDVASRDLTPAMMAMLKTVTYIRWGEEPEARESFWGRMRLALHDLITDRQRGQGY